MNDAPVIPDGVTSYQATASAAITNTCTHATWVLPGGDQVAAAAGAGIIIALDSSGDIDAALNGKTIQFTPTITNRGASWRVSIDLAGEPGVSTDMEVLACKWLHENVNKQRRVCDRINQLLKYVGRSEKLSRAKTQSS